MLKYSLMICLLMRALLPVQAQTVIKGKVVDDQSGLGIPFATVHLLSSVDSSLLSGKITDTAGIFEWTGMRAGSYVLAVSSLGYAKLQRKVVVSGPTDLGNISIARAAGQLGEVTITGEKPPLQRVDDKLLVNVSGNRLFAGAANAYDILKKIPGLEVAGDGSLLLSGRVAPAVFIDGKPVPMSPEELQQYLAGLTPEMIASIEVINNPSARYDGEYKGIINIRLQRDAALGLKGSINVSVQQHAYTLADNTLALLYKTKKWVYTTRFGYTAGQRIRKYDALQHLANTNMMATRTKVLTGNNNPMLQLGAEYSPDKNKQIGLVLRASGTNQPIASYNTLHTTDATAHTIISDLYTDNSSIPRQRNYAAYLNYTAQTGKNQLDLLASILYTGNRQWEDIQTRNAFTEQLQDHWKTALKNNILIRLLQADLSRSLGNGKLSAGARFALTTTRNDLHYDTLNTAGMFETDSSRTNNLRYDEYVTATYLSYSQAWEKLSGSLSLRAEHTRSIANAVTDQQVTKRSYLTWLPAISITYAFNAVRQLNLAYSRRMTRPNFAQLNPFRFYNSPLNYVVGNPYLQPSTTDMLSLAYTQKAFNISFQIGRESDPLARYPEYDPVTNVLEYLGRNLPFSDFAVIEVSFPLKIARWWTMQHNIRGAYRKEQTPYHGETYAIPVTDYTISGSQVLTLSRSITFDLSYYHRSRSGNGLYIFKPTGKVDLGLQKSWGKGEWITRINYYDILDTWRTAYIFREKRIIDNEFEHWFGNRKLGISLSYNFGRSTHSGKQRNKNEEEMRAGM